MTATVPTTNDHVMAGRAVVTGGTGIVGVPLIHRLVDTGYEVTVLARRRPVPGLLPSGIRVVLCDVQSEEDVAGTISTGSVVIHLAARKRGLLAGSFQANVRGTSAVVRAARAAGAARVVVASTVHVYGRTDGGHMAEESTPPRPRSAYAWSKLAAEEAARSLLPPDEGPALVVLRFAAVHGGGGDSHLARLERAVRSSGGFRVVPWGPGVRTIVHVEDAAEAVLLAAKHPAAEGATLNVTDGYARPVRDLVADLFASVGRPVPWLRVPWPRHDLAVDGSRIQSLLGFSPSRRFGALPAGAP